MEFGNLQYKIYLIIPFFILGIIIIGIIKKKKILSFLKLSIHNIREISRLILYLVATVLLVISLLSPEKFKEGVNSEFHGTDLYIIFDVSNSMLAEDIYPNRLLRGKIVVEKILENLKGDRVGFIPFSSSAYIQMPLTDDYQMAKSYLAALDTNLMSGGGTKLLSALEIANKSFEESGAKNKNVLIISDGGEEISGISEFIKNNKINVYSIGIATEQGSPIPFTKNGKREGFIKNDKGEIVISKINANFLKEISQGGYYKINSSTDETSDFLKSFNQLEKKIIKTEKRGIYDKYYQYPLALALLLLLIAHLIARGVKNNVEEI